ncbi:MAG: hypothetical protein IJ467_04145 [Bacteroidaceae bacterium]|nr:hypothetical protein [Bacteroidaceae bacterium]
MFQPKSKCNILTINAEFSKEKPRKAGSFNIRLRFTLNRVNDHIILTSEGFYSYDDEGRI